MNKKLTEKSSLIFLLCIILLFTVMLLVSSYLTGAVGTVIYYLAFILPVALFFTVARIGKISLHTVPVRIKREDIGLLIPTVMPTLAVVFLISFLTSIILSAIGVEDTPVDVSGNIFLMIILHALLPALLEEVLFRYIPMALLLSFSRWRAVIISSLLFALAHGSLYQIPYAFIAGAVFIILDITFDSIMPSVIIHFINNLVSVFWLRNSEDTVFAAVYIGLLVLLAAASAVLIFRKKDSYKERFCLHFVERR